jgi:hypothetical protein
MVEQNADRVRLLLGAFKDDPDVVADAGGLQFSFKSFLPEGAGKNCDQVIRLRILLASA